MKIKMSTIVISIKNIEDNRPKDLPAVLSFKVSRLLRQLKSEFEIFENQRVQLIQKYGVKEGDNLSVPKESYPDFYKELGEILSLELSIDTPEITIDDFNGMELSSKFTDGLEPFMTIK